MKKQKQLLIDNHDSISIQLVERGENEPQKVIVRGEFASIRPTQNKRHYGPKLWENNFLRLGDAISQRKILGAADHPADGRSYVSNVSHVITGLSLDNGIVVGEAELLDTAKGRDLQAILKSGCKVGVSSRGRGSVITNDKGIDVVQDDYQLETFDFVLNPANITSYPDVFFEETETDMVDEIKPDPKEAKKDEDPTKSAIEHILTTLKPLLVSEDIVKQKDSAIEEMKKELEALKDSLKQANDKIESLESDNVALSDLARETGYKFFLEKSLSQDPDADLIRDCIGDVKLFESVESLSSKVDSVRYDLDRRRRKEESLLKKREFERDRERKESLDQKQALESKLNKIQEALEKSTEINKLLSIKLYTEQRLYNHPQSAQIKPLLESADLSSTEEVDQFISNFKAPKLDRDDLDQVRARVRKMHNGARSQTSAEEEKPTMTESIDDYNGLGAPLATLKKIAGIPS